MNEEQLDDPFSRWVPRAFEGMSLAEVLKFREGLRAAHRAGNFGHRRPYRDHPFTSSEVLKEVRLIVRDMVRLREDWPDGNGRLLLLANLIVMIRDHDRGPAEGPIDQLGHSSGFFVSWLIERAGGNGGPTPFPEAFEQVRAAVADSERTTELGRELREFIDGTVSGEIDDDEWYRRIKSARKLARKKPLPILVPEGAIHLADASALLSALVAKRPQSFRGAWDAFSEFTQVPVIAKPPETISEDDGDLLLFEWGFSENGLSIQFVRQFGIEENDGGHRLEQITCSMTIADIEQPNGLSSDINWSSCEGFASWFADVQEDQMFQTMFSADPRMELKVESSPV